MAYQNVGTPRFYVSWGDYWKAQGWQVARNHTISPYETYSDTISDGITTPEDADEWEIYSSTAPYSSTNPRSQSWIPANGSRGANFLAVLNHNLSGGTWKFFNKRNVWANEYEGSDDLGDNADYGAENDDYHVEIVNSHPLHSGFSIHTHNGTNEDYTDYSKELVTSGFSTTSGEEDAVEFTGTFGCYVWGKYYDMPHSPDLELKMSIEMDGVKNKTNLGGVSSTNISYMKPKNWGTMGAWQLGNATTNDPSNPGITKPSNLRNGRRSWDLSFSHLSNTNIMPTNQDVFQPGNLTGSDFFSQVWNRTMGGHLPFIFNPSGGGTSPNNSPDQFAICRFDMKSLKYEQVAKNIYNVKLKIKESW